MSERDEILSAIQNGIGVLAPLSVSSREKAYDLFEWYVFGIMIDAACQEGARVTFEDIDGRVPASLVFRTSPGWIYRKSPTGTSYTHAVLTFDKAAPLEVHVGIYVAGRSQSLHELDVAVVDRQEARLCRARGISPSYKSLQIGAECKFHTSSPITLGIGRGFVGLTSDFGQAKLHLVTNKGAESVEFFLTKKGKQTDFGVVPRNRARVDKVRSILQRAFYQYKAQQPINCFGD